MRGLGPTYAEGRKLTARPLLGAIYGPYGPEPGTALSSFSLPSSIMTPVSVSYLPPLCVLRLPSSLYALDQISMPTSLLCSSFWD